MKCSLGISNFLEIFTLSYSIVFLYSFALITEEGFLISSCYSLELCIQMLTNLDSLLKSRDITLLKKVHIVKAMVFPVVMYGCES